MYGFPRAIVSPDTHCSVRESDGSSCGVVRVAGLLFTSLLSPASPFPHPPSLRPLDVALACAKLRAINVATSEFFVNSQAVCLSLPMIRSLRCLRNAKGPIAVQLCRGFEPSFLVVVNVPHVYAPLALLSRDFRVRAYRSSRLSEPEASQRGALIFRRVI